ncbi:MAG: acyl carrier protein [Betaproteobacteria bacterium]|nr:acyl carrier protein [Betaproteobacteria bacterium]
MNTLEDVKHLLDHALQLGGRASAMQADSPLLGALPELDSMAVVNVIASLEEHFGISVLDDDINADTFATLGSLAAFVDSKLAA